MDKPELTKEQILKVAKAKFLIGTLFVDFNFTREEVWFLIHELTEASKELDEEYRAEGKLNERL